MVIFTVVLLAIAQGFTEFLPISSSAHLFLIPWAFNLPNLGLRFDAAIHIGTALALLLFFWKDFYGLFVKRDKLLIYILIASLIITLSLLIRSYQRSKRKNRELGKINRSHRILKNQVTKLSANIKMNAVHNKKIKSSNTLSNFLVPTGTFFIFTE